MESVKFIDINFEYLSPIPDELKLTKLDTSNETTENQIKYEILNQNIEKLNSLLYGHQDYAVIGTK